MTNFDEWYCCLPDPERFMFATLAASYPAWLAGYPTALFDAAWAAFFAPSSLARRHAFISNYFLEEETWTPSEGDPFQVYVPTDLIWWAQALAWWYTGVHICSDGCELKTFP